MSASSDRNAELQELLSKLIDGELGAEEARRLNELLRREPAAREMYLEQVALHAQLERELGGEVPELGAAGVMAERAEKIVPLRQPERSAWGAIRGRFLPSWAWAAAASLVLAAVIGSLVLMNQSSASAAELVRHALKAHAATMDRCYRIGLKMEAASGLEKGPATENRLWTRGDRCWIETRSGNQTVAWGHDEQGQVWFALSPKVGVRFDPVEASQRMGLMRERMEQFGQMRGGGPGEFARCFERLSLTCDLCSLQVETLLQGLLADFDLRREASGANGYLIQADLKAGHTNAFCHKVALEVDTASGVLRSLVVKRLHNGQPAAEVTFTLVETGEQPDVSYTLAGHLGPDAVIYDRGSGPLRQGPLLMDFMGVLWGEPAAK